MNSSSIALIIGAFGLALGIARLVVSILSYRLDARRRKPAHKTASTNERVNQQLFVRQLANGANRLKR